MLMKTALARECGVRHWWNRAVTAAELAPLFQVIPVVAKYGHVEVATKVGNARSSSALGISAGRMGLKDEARGGELRAMASAQVYFNRPYDYAPFKRMVWGRSDGKFEQGSMFSPYWQARLVDTPQQDKLLLVAAP